MKVEITLSEEELSKLVEKAIQEKMKLSEDMKLIETRSYSGVYVFSDEKEEVEK